MKSRFVLLLVRVIVGGAFIVAGWPKAREPGKFIRDIWNFHLLPETWAYWIAAFVPYLEIAAGLALITGLQRRGAHLVLMAMLGVFLVFHATAWARGLDVECGCFGSAVASTGFHPAAWIALVIALMAGVAWSAAAGRRSTLR